MLIESVNATAMSAARRRRATHKEKMARKWARRAHTPSRPMVPATARDLTIPAYKRLKRNMEAFGNTLSDAHEQALMRIVGCFTLLAAGRTTGRYAYPLFCGGGKTQAVIAWCAELWHQQQPYSVLICQTQVEHLCELKRQLIKNGVPGGEVGLVHSYGDRASLPPTTGNQDKRILLATHQNIRTGRDIAAVNTFDGQRRDLVIWDESLLCSDHRSVEKMHVQQGLGLVLPMVENNRASADLQDATAYLKTAWRMLSAEFERQAEGNVEPRVITLPRLTAEDQDRLVAAIPTKEYTKAIRELLSISQAPLRVVTGSGGGGLITYDVVVPDALSNVAILDASYPIRDLQRLDRSIKEDPLFHGNVKSYETVTVYHLDGASGRKAMTEAFTKPRADRKVSKEIVQVVKERPEDEGVLLFTFKHDPGAKVDMAEKLRGDLRAEGVDVDKELANGKPRFAWLTWGQETSTSEFGYCTNVIFAGVLHRADVDLAGAIAGQRDDLTVDISHAEIESIKRSEIAHSLLQAINRGSARATVDGKAGRMKVWLIHYDKAIRKTLSLAMPGLVWKDWEPKHIRAKGHKLEDAVKAITTALASLPASTTRIATRQLKGFVNGLDVSPRTWTKALKACLESEAGWELQGRSAVRS